MGQEGGQAMMVAIDVFLTPRLARLQENLLDVFAERLMTIEDSPPHPPQLVARAEFTIFIENTEQFVERMQQETKAAVSDWYDLAKDLGLTPIFKDYVRSRAEGARLKMTMLAIEMVGDAVLAADPSAARPDLSSDIAVKTK
jgi:hypothetical protein